MTDAPYTIRNYRPADFDSYVRLCREARSLKPSDHPVSPQIVAEWLNWPEAGAARECRSLKEGEEDTLTRIQNRCFAGTWGYNPNTPETIAYFTRLGGFFPEKVILACEDNNVTGYCWTEIISKDEGEIHMLGTDPGFRGREIGRRVLLAGLAYLRSKGVPVARLTVDSENTEAYSLYESVGFELRKVSLWYEKAVD
jgi:ribosomal protein S18 acetylase RimI-like enzyme